MTLSIRRLPNWMLIILMAISRMAYGQADSFSFIQWSDPQFGMFSDNHDFDREIVNFRRAIQVANQVKPGFVVVTGDLVNRTGDSAQIGAFKRVARELDPSIRLYLVPGNHDVGNEASASSIAAYRRQFGPDYYAFHYRHLLGIVLNSVYLHSPDAFPSGTMAQEKWLLQTLADAKDKGYRQVMIFLHHPFFLENPGESDQYFNIPSAVRKKYLGIFKANHIRYVFAGHYHRNALGHDGELEMVTTGPVGKPLGETPSGYRLVRVEGNRVSHVYYSLGKLP